MTPRALPAGALGLVAGASRFVRRYPRIPRNAAGRARNPEGGYPARAVRRALVRPRNP